MCYKLYKHSVNKVHFNILLKLTADADQRHFHLRRIFVGKNAYFRLKTALFVEKRQNKFAYVLK